MRIRKRHVFSSSPHFPVTPPSDPHLNNRSPVVVQLSDATTTAPEPSQRGSSGILSLDRPHQPSDQPFLPINGWDDPSGIGESGAQGQHSKQDPSVSEENNFCFLFLILCLGFWFLLFFCFVFSKFHDVGFYKCTFVQSLASGCCQIRIFFPF